MAKGVVGAQLYTVRDFCKTLPDIAETAKKVAQMGYTAVQLSGFPAVDPKEVAKIMAGEGLTVAATHFGWDRFLKALDGLIEEHRIYGCKHLAIGGLGAEYRNADGVKRFLDELAPVAEKLATHGMDFSYHNHNHELARYGQKTWLAMLYEQGDPKHLKAELDTYWIQAGGGDPVAWIRKCAGREPLLHLKDMCVTPSREQRFAEIGEGNLNWPDILQAADQGGVEYYLVEQDQCYERKPFESLAISCRNLKAMGLK
ncbi:MAG: sugar phosphate isomerase/epimerase [Planctomycetes bacterium]|nr:sugar phosphate isomerase/epimerase [Planctomycetota bacterium]MBM4081654.1 sugar phosphate isomerase/epimerase [Planctomycetota bacterium]